MAVTGNTSESPGCGAMPPVQFAPLDQFPLAEPSHVRVAARVKVAPANSVATRQSRCISFVFMIIVHPVHRGTPGFLSKKVKKILGPREGLQRAPRGREGRAKPG